MEVSQVLPRLCALAGVSGREESAGAAAVEMLREFVPDARFENGSVLGTLRTERENAPKLLLCAHLDRVGFMVTDITKEGFLRLAPVGGVDKRILPGQSVTVHGTKPLRGVICAMPPHLSHGAAEPKDSPVYADVGAADAKELEGLVRRGDTVTFAERFVRLSDGLCSAPGLDNRAGVAALLKTAELLQKDKDLPADVVFAFSGGEERSGRGASILGDTVKPQIAVIVDTTFGACENEPEPRECFALGSGPAIGFSAVLSQALSEALVKTAEQNGIPYSREIMPQRTGTDADTLELAGALCGTVSIPLRYMHTPAEIVDVSDIEQTAKLLAAFTRSEALLEGTLNGKL